MSLNESGEMYLETVYILSLRKTTVRSVDVAEWMNYSKPSVSRGIGLLRDAGYIRTDINGSITLTEEGRHAASRIYEKHTVLRDALINIGIDEATAAEDACRIEHVISEKSFAAIKQYLEQNRVAKERIDTENHSRPSETD